MIYAIGLLVMGLIAIASIFIIFSDKKLKHFNS